jgi:hypothetical protein
MLTGGQTFYSDLEEEGHCGNPIITDDETDPRAAGLET